MANKPFVLDTTTIGSLTDAKGKLVLDQSDPPQPIPCAFDAEGNKYKKVLEAVGEKDPKKASKKQRELMESGAQHFSSNVPGFTGWWEPVVEEEVTPPPVSNVVNFPGAAAA